MKELYEAYKNQYMRNPFDSTTLDTGNELISKMAGENKSRWEEMITSTNLTGNIRTAWQTIRKISKDPGGVCPQIQGRQCSAYVGAVEEMMCVVCVDVTEGA